MAGGDGEKCQDDVLEYIEVGVWECELVDSVFCDVVFRALSRRLEREVRRIWCCIVGVAGEGFHFILSLACSKAKPVSFSCHGNGKVLGQVVDGCGKELERCI